MFRHQSQTLPSTKKKPNKLIAGFIACAATAAIATSGLAAAQTNDKPTKAECLAAGFTNYGQCVKEWALNKNHPGHGYGGNDISISNDLTINLDHSNNNIIKVVTNTVINIFN